MKPDGFHHEEHEGTRRLDSSGLSNGSKFPKLKQGNTPSRVGPPFVLFVSFVVNTTGPDRFDHEEHEGTRRLDSNGLSNGSKVPKLKQGSTPFRVGPPFVLFASFVVNTKCGAGVEPRETGRQLEQQRLPPRMGFELRVKGSHHIFARGGVAEILNLQPKGRQAKPYQVKQVRGIIVKYRLGETNVDSI